MDNRRQEPNQDSQRKDMPEEVLNAEQDRSSIKDPLKVQNDRASQNEEATLEQQRKEAMTERD